MNLTPEADHARLFKRIGLIGAVGTILLGALGLLGWITGLQILTRTRADLIPIAPSTAIAFIFLGSVLLVHINRGWRGRSASVVAVIVTLVAVFGLLQLIGYFAGMRLNFEDAFLQDLGMWNGVPLAAMAPRAGVVFSLIGLAILLLIFQVDRAKVRGWVANWIGGLALLVTAVSLTFVVAYLLGTPFQYGSRAIPLSVITATGFVLLGVAIAAAAGPDAFPARWFVGTSTHARLMRVITPLVFLIGLVTIIAYRFVPNLLASGDPTSIALLAALNMLGAGSIFSLASRRVGRAIDRAEADRQEAENELRALFAAMTDVVIVLDADGRYLQIAPTDHSRLYRPATESLGKTVHQVLPAPQAQVIHAHIRRVLAERQTLHVEYSLPIGGAEIWFDAAVSPLSENTVFWVAHDISERRQALQALRESEERYRQLVELSPEAIAVHTEGRVVFVNPAAVTLMGAQSAAELIGKPVLEMAHPDFRGNAQMRVREGYQEHKAAPLQEEKFIRVDGTAVDVEVRSAPIVYQGKPAMQAIARDITERKRAEQALKESEQQFQILAEVAPVGIFRTDRHGQTLYVNPRWCEISKLTFDQALGDGWLTAVHPDDRAPLAAAWEKAVSERTGSQADYRFLRANGSTAWVVGQSVPQFDSRGEIVGYIGTITDITERKRADEAEREQRTLAEALRDTAMALNSTLDSVEVMDSILNNLDRVLPHDASNIMIIEQGDARIARCRGIATVAEEQTLLGLRLPLANFFNLRKIVETGQPFVVSDTRNNPAWVVIPKLHTIGSYIGVPIRAREGQVIGILNVDSATPAFFNTSDAARLQAFADQAGIALENARLYSQIQDQATQLETRVAERTSELKERVVQVETLNRAMTNLLQDVRSAHRIQQGTNQELARLHTQVSEKHIAEQAVLLRLSQALLSENNSQKIMDYAVRAATEAFAVEMGMLILLDESNQDVSVPATLGWTPEFVKKVQQIASAEVSTFGKSLRSRKPFIMRDITLDGNPPSFLRQDGVKAAIIVARQMNGKNLAALTVSSRMPRDWTEDEVRLVSLIANTTAQALERVRLFEQVSAGRERFESLSHRLVEVQESERRYIASELHDEIGQMLTGLRLLLTSNADSATQSTPHLGEAQTLVSDLMMRVRNLSLDLRPAMLDDLGLLPALIWFIGRYETQTQVRVSFNHMGIEGQRFPREVETTAYRIVQEALTNVARHAGVPAVNVRLWARDQILEVQIEDTGSGFDPATMLAAGKSSGLAGMRERASLLGGQLTISSAPGTGTHIVADLPLGDWIERRRGERLSTSRG